MKQFLIAATAVVGLLYVGKKLSEGERREPAPSVPVPPVPVESPIAFNIKDGDKVVSTEVPGKELPVLLTYPTTLLVATSTPFTEPENQLTIQRSSVVKHLPRKKA